MKAVQIDAHGDLDALKFVEDAPIPEPGPKEIQVKLAAAGINFIDTYQRSGLYPNPSGKWPFTLGKEGAGIVTKVGDECKTIEVGSRVAFSGGQGTYAEYVSIAESAVVRVPDEVSLKDAAAIMLQGLTAHYLVTSTRPIKEGMTVLIHAGAGGTGGILIQMAKLLGATVITTVGTPEKAELAKKHGADHVIIYTEQDFHEEVMKITDGKKVPAVYDGVGKATWEKSLQCCAPLGHLILFGNASGAVPPINPLDLTKAGSVALTRPSLFHYIKGDMLQKRCDEMFQWMREGKVKVLVGHEYDLKDAKQAQEDLSTRKTTGKLLLVAE